MLSEQEVMQIYFASDRPRKDAVIATEVDLYQFAQNLERAIILQAGRQERDKCVEFVQTLNTHVARALSKAREY